jgi:pSer/pThr/pTyr-binding forkhead associated (FHA) protein/CRP-like cAMP-binding protein
MAFLIQSNDGVKSTVLPLGRALILIGRDPGSNLYLDDSSISKNHASIVYSGGGHILRDNGSTNGTLVNGNPVREHRLAHGDSIQFGSYHFVVDLENPVPAVKAPGESGIELERSGRAYGSSLKLPEIPGMEACGALQVVMSDKPRSAPPPLPPTGFLENLCEEDRQDLSSRGNYHFARCGETLVREGQETGRLFFLISGRLEARVGKPETLLGTISPGEWIGEVNIFDPAGAVCSVVAVEPTEYWEISRGDFERFINESRSAGSAVLIALASTLGRRIRQSTGSLQEAVKTASRLRRPKLAIALSAAALCATLAAAWFFFSGASDKSRLEAKNTLIEKNRVESISEARARIQSLQSELDAAKSDLDRSLLENRGLASELDSVRAELLAAKSAPQTPAKPAPPQEESAPAPRAEATPTAGTSESAEPTGHPSKVTVTTKTTIPAMVDGRVSGSVTIPVGRELVATGTDGDQVLVDFGGATQKIPKANTNFAEALATEVQRNAQAAKPQTTPLAQASTPKSTPVAAKPPKPQAPAPKHAGTAEVDALMNDAGILETLKELGRLRSSSEPDASRAFRSIAAKWSRISADAAGLLSTGNPAPGQAELLKKFIEASEIADHKRIQMFEAKIREIDAAWIKLKTGEKIESVTGDAP